jgi:HPt (histidine-containing phosphotransfer) domain-containing protein
LFIVSRSFADGLTKEQVTRYLARREQDLRVIFESLDSSRSQPIREIAHKVKGNAALYGLPEIGVIAAKLLGEADREEWSAMRLTARELADKLDHEKGRVLEAEA